MKVAVFVLFLVCINGIFARVDNYFSIFNPLTGLVVDGKDEMVKTANFDHSDSQLWKLSSASDNKYYIVNKHNGKVLEAGTTNGAQVRAVPKSNNKKQEWGVNLEGSTFVNAQNRALDAKGENGGNQLVIYPRNGFDCQKFKLNYVN